MAQRDGIEPGSRSGRQASEPGSTIQDLGDLGHALRQIVRRARKTSGKRLTCRELADETGYAHSSVNNWLQGRSLPSADHLGDLLVAVGATAAEQRALATARDDLEERRRPTASPGDHRPGSCHPWAARPQQLPRANPRFAGRASEITALAALLDRPDADAGTVVLITGAAGAGKTALAVHVCRRVLDRFPDGCLYADMRGFSPSRKQRMSADQVISDFLLALGIRPAEIPASPEAREARYRSELDGKRLLVVLDDAYDTSQVLPLLPGSPSCAVVVTSRNQLDGLIANGADVSRLVGLPAGECHELLARYLGSSRLAREPAAVDRLIALSSGLPRTLSALAARGAALPHLELTDLAADLAARTHGNARFDQPAPHGRAGAHAPWLACPAGSQPRA